MRHVAEPWTLAVIIGSVRDGRIGHGVAGWFIDQMHDGPYAHVQVDLIDLATLDLPHDLSGSVDSVAFGDRIERSDAVVIITPEYNRGYPGPLKNAIDTVTSPWKARPIGFVAYGGVSGGLRAVEQLRPVFAELHAVTVQAAVALPYAWDLVDAEGAVHAPRAESAAATMLDQLAWWARALHGARTASPYLA